jgi:aldehyde dehydrogenase (NAD+)
MYEYDKLFIGGQWVAPTSDKFIEVHSPATLELVGRTPEAVEADVDAAVAAARKAFDEGPWPRMTPAERAAVLTKVNEQLAANTDETVGVISSELGQPSLAVQMMQVFPSQAVLGFYPGLADSFAWEEEKQGIFATFRVRKEPVGVVGAIIAWNVPLFLAFNKLVPALLAGCTVVLKPAPETPLTTNVIADWFVKAGLPEGVLSVLPAGREVGEHLVTHPGIDKVSFTGSVAAGKRVGMLAAERLKRCTLELGGKSAAILLDDFDIAANVDGLVMSGLNNSGQACVAQTRILAPRSRYQEISEAIAATASAYKLGGPDDAEAQMGPLVAERQRDRVEGYIAKGKAEGAKLATGGGRPKGLDKGWYVEPTVFVDVDNKMTIAQEEIFGPVLSVIPYDGEAEAVRIANDSDYGLAGSVWTNDVEKGLEIARQVRTGTFGINWYAFDMAGPFGGYKCSGIGREDGVDGLAAFCETKQIVMPMGWAG